jgi:hypothetical protein
MGNLADSLASLYEYWTAQNNLPRMSADELLEEDGVSVELTDKQRSFLRHFIGIWEEEV